MNITGLEVFILTFLIVAVLVLVIFQNQSIKGSRIGEVRKSINIAIGPNFRGIIKVVFVIALIVVQFKLDFQHAFIFGIFGGICIGLMAYFFDPKIKRNRANIILNNLKTLGVQFILIAINWYLLWMESDQTMLFFSFSTIPIYFLFGLIFLRPTGKREFLSVMALFGLLFVNAIATAVNFDAIIPPEVVNPISSCVAILVSADTIGGLITTFQCLYLGLAFVPPLFMYLGILARKQLDKRKVSKVNIL